MIDVKPGIDSVVKENDLIITSDVFPAVNGMSVEVNHDEQAQTLLEKWLEAGQ